MDLQTTAANLWAASQTAIAAAARLDVCAFIEHVLRDESTGRPVRLADVHRRWHELADKHDRLILWAAIEHGKTANLSIGRVLFALGQNPTARVAIVSNTHAQASKIVRSIARYIESSAELRQVFPHLRPATPWSDSQLAIERPVVSKDPSVAAYGIGGAVLGARLDLIIIDDALDFENARTDEQRRKLLDWTLATLFGRLTEHGWVIIVGTAFSPEDMMHVLAKQGWPNYKFSVEKEDGTPQWPERWSPQRIAKKRAELGPIEAARQLDCQVRSEADAVFRSEWIAHALGRGEKATPIRFNDLGEPYLLHHAPPARIVVGVDPAVSKKSSADQSAIAVVLQHPDRVTRELLAVESGHWSGPEIIDRVLSVHRRFLADVIVVEGVAAQGYLIQWLKASGERVRIESFTTGRDKMSLEWRGQQLAKEMANGAWVFPARAPGCARDKETAQLMRDLLYWTPADHCPDRLAALLFAQWGCERGARRIERGFIDLTGR